MNCRGWSRRKRSAAWFAGGLRIIDIANPHQPIGVGRYARRPAGADRRPTSNDVFVDKRGLIYRIDRHNGLDILRVGGGQQTKRRRGAISAGRPWTYAAVS